MPNNVKVSVHDVYQALQSEAIALGLSTSIRTTGGLSEIATSLVLRDPTSREAQALRSYEVREAVGKAIKARPSPLNPHLRDLPSMANHARTALAALEGFLGCEVGPDEFDRAWRTFKQAAPNAVEVVLFERGPRSASSKKDIKDWQKK